MYFNIHDLVRIKVQTSIDSKVDVALKHFREFEEQRLDDKDVDLFIYDYSECPSFKDYSVVSECEYSDNWLNVPDERFCFNFVDRPLVVYCDSYKIPLTFLVELVLLSKGYSLIHSAAVRYNKKNYLLVGFGGVGKTTIVSAIIDDGGKLFGDDIVIVNGKEVLSFPRDFAIYPYHLEVLKIRDKEVLSEFGRIKQLNRLFKSGMGRALISMMNSFLTRRGYVAVAPGRILNFVTKEGYVSVSPKKIFGADCIAERGRIDDVYYLSRADVPELTVEKINFDLAKNCAYTLLYEWHQSMPLLSIYSGLSDFSLDPIYNQIYNLFRRAFTRHKCRQIKIPNNLDNLTFQKQLISYFRKRSGAENYANAT